MGSSAQEGPEGSIPAVKIAVSADSAAFAESLRQRLSSLGHGCELVSEAMVEGYAHNRTRPLEPVLWPLLDTSALTRFASFVASGARTRVAVLCIGPAEVLERLSEVTDGGSVAGFLAWPASDDALRASLDSLALVARQRVRQARATPSVDDSAESRELARAARTAVHDINNALSAIRCNAYLIQTDPSSNDDVKEAANDILTAVIRGERTTAGLSPKARALCGDTEQAAFSELASHTARPTNGATQENATTATSAAPERTPNAAPKPAAKGSSSGAVVSSVLVVDDDAAVRRGVSRSLRALGMHVMEAGSADAALAVLAREHVDLMLTDVVMPEQNGYELATISARFHPEVRIAFMSGYAPAAAPLPASQAGAFAPILHKPFAVDALRQLIAELSTPAPNSPPQPAVPNAP